MKHAWARPLCLVFITSSATPLSWKTVEAMEMPQQGEAASDTSAVTPDENISCDSASVEPSPAYPLHKYTSAEMAAMFDPPTDVSQLLTNLKIILDHDLLAQPAFYENSILLKVFGGTNIRWVGPDTPNVGGDRFIAPTRIAVITASAAISKYMMITVGTNHKCLNRRTDPRNSKAYIPAHTYDSGYIHLQLDGFEEFTFGTVRSIFGPNSGFAHPSCDAFPYISYDAHSIADKNRNFFSWNAATFTTNPRDYKSLCKLNRERTYDDSALVNNVSIRLIEEDYTQTYPLVY